MIRKSKEGFSIIEMAVVLAISISLISISMPAITKRIRDGKFLRFAGELTGHLAAARIYGQTSGLSSALDFAESETDRYRFQITNLAGAWETRSISSWGRGSSQEIRNRLPPFALPHPTGSGNIDRALSSTHGDRIVFSARGSSSATIVFSDGVERVLCVVLAAQSGRFRVYFWDQLHQDWIPFY